NTMVDQLSAFSSEVTRVAREVGTEGALGGQAQVPGVAGVWKELTDSVNTMAGNLTAQVRGIAEVTTAVANGDLSRKVTVPARRDAQPDDRAAAGVRRRGDAGRQRGRGRGAAGRPGARAGRGGDVEGPDGLRQHGVPEPHHPGAGHRRGDDGGGQR